MSRTDKAARRARRKKEATNRHAARMRAAEREGEIVACYVNEDWRDEGMASLHLLRQLPDGSLAFGCFLVDTFCFGLKDAWGMPRITMADFRKRVLDRVPDEVKLVRCDFEVLKRLVLGSVAHARRNGFRLPPRYEKFVRMVGSLETIDQADTRDFGMDGRLRYIGSIEELGERLVGVSIEEFMQRPDVDVTFTGHMRHPDMTSPFDGDEGGDFDESDFQEMVNRMTDAVRQWCFANGQAPRVSLRAIVEEFFDVILCDAESQPEAGLSESVVETHLTELVAWIEQSPPAKREYMKQAFEQMMSFIQSLKDEKSFCQSIGMTESFDESEDRS